MATVSTDTEQKIRGAHAQGQLKDAATLTLEAYGGEILSFLHSRLRRASDAQDVYSMFVEDLWLGLPEFAWRCSMRTWAYALARNAAARHLSSAQRKSERPLDTDQLSEISKIAERLRSSTDICQRTEAKDRVRALREQLEPEDQMLLVLRVDRNLAWQDLALVMSGDTNLDDAAVTRESARLRKAFERVKGQLRSLAEREGLLKPRE